MKNGRTCLILTGGTIEVAMVESYLQQKKVDFVIAVDRGLNAADTLQLKVDVIVGDFDSVSKEVLEKYEMLALEGTVRIRRLVPEKDMTDTQVALEMAIEERMEEIIVVGATGTRFDHVLANVNLLMIPLRNKVKACILDTNNKIYLINHSITIHKKDLFGNYVSLLPLTNEVTGVTLHGMKYPLSDYTLVQGDSLGVSNELLQETGQIELQEGVLIVIESHD